MWSSMEKLLLFFCRALAECSPSNPLSKLTVSTKTSQTAGGKGKVEFSGAEPTNGISHCSEPLGGKHTDYTQRKQV